MKKVVEKGEGSRVIPSMARETPYSVGRRWYCDLSAKGRESFTFVVIGPGEKPGEKLCRLEYDNPKVHGLGHGTEQIYSHKHLKKYAKLVTG